MFDCMLRFDLRFWVAYCCWFYCCFVCWRLLVFLVWRWVWVVCWLVVFLGLLVGLRVCGVLASLAVWRRDFEFSFSWIGVM